VNRKKLLSQADPRMLYPGDMLVPGGKSKTQTELTKTLTSFSTKICPSTSADPQYFKIINVNVDKVFLKDL